MIRLALSLCVHLLLRWNARENAAAQRKFAAELEHDMHAARRGIKFYNDLVHEYDEQVRHLRQETRARRMAKLFRGSA